MPSTGQKLNEQTWKAKKKRIKKKQQEQQRLARIHSHLKIYFIRNGLDHFQRKHEQNENENNNADSVIWQHFQLTELKY